MAGHPHRRQHLAATASTPSASRPGSPTPTASPRSCATSRPGAGRSARRSRPSRSPSPWSRPQAGFRTTVGWYAGCRVGRLQVLDAYRVDNIGDEAAVLMLRLWKRPVTTLLRRGRPDRQGHDLHGRHARSARARPRPREITQSLADSVAMLCARSGSGGCAKRPTYRVVPPPPSGEERGILAVADLPPVGRIAQPWVGTEPARRRRNPSATTCDRADFAKAGATRTRTRTFLIPEAPLPARFGLSETYGRFRTAGRREPVPGRRTPQRRRAARTATWRPRSAASAASGRGPRSSTCPAGTCRPRSATSRRCASGSASSGSATPSPS